MERVKAVARIDKKSRRRPLSLLARYSDTERDPARSAVDEDGEMRVHVKNQLLLPTALNAIHGPARCGGLQRSERRTLGYRYPFGSFRSRERCWGELTERT